MKPLFFPAVILLSLVLLLPSCTKRSISDSGYRHSHGYHGSRGANPGMGYHGELTEWDVLGDGSNPESENSYTPVRLTRGDRLLVIQSGAFFPDEQMMRELDPYFDAVMFSGIPPAENDPELPARLRAAARNGGCSKLFVYWGVLEIARRDEATMAISWVPVAGRIVPDRTQTIRIRVRGFIVDTRSGNWSMVTADSFEDERLSSSLTREPSDQTQVSRLKGLAYKNLVSKLL